MISFKKTLEINKTIKLAEECFYLMESCGISSVNFVDWIENNYNENLIENVNLWLRTEINFMENYSSESILMEQPSTLSQAWKDDTQFMRDIWNSETMQDLKKGGQAAWEGMKTAGTKALEFGDKAIPAIAQPVIKGTQALAKGAANLAGNVMQGAAKGIAAYANYRDIKSMTKNVDLAKQKLYDLIKKGEREGSILKNTDVQTAIMALHKELQKLDKSTIARISQEPPQYDAQPEFQQQAELPKGQTYSPSAPMTVQQAQQNLKQQKKSALASSEEAPLPDHVSNLGEKLFETRIKSLCYKLDDLKINPYLFASCFVSEFCEDHNIMESNWLGGAWSGLKGAVKGGWERLMGGGEGSFWDAVQKGYVSGRDTKYDEYDRQAIQDAINHLASFAKQIQGSTIEQVFKNRINNVVGNLNKALSFKAQQAQQMMPPEAATSSDQDTGGMKTSQVGQEDYEAMQQKLKAGEVSTQQEKKAAEDATKAISDQAKLDAANKFFAVGKKGSTKQKIVEKWAKLNDAAKIKIIDSNDYKNIVSGKDGEKTMSIQMKGQAYKNILKMIDTAESSKLTEPSVAEVPSEKKAPETNPNAPISFSTTDIPQEKIKAAK